MDPHTIESDRESIETYRDEKHPRTRISDERSDRLDEGRMPFLYCEEIRSPDHENNTEKSPKIHRLMEKKHTRKHGRNRDQSLHRSDERYISEGEGLEVEILSEVVEEPTSSNNPDK